ncbi:MAG: Ig-like domain repeat protein [Pyrinomonadaceae bacterium]
MTVGTLPAGKTETVTLNVTVSNSLDPQVKEVSNQATIAGSNFSGVQTDGDGNRANGQQPTITRTGPPETFTVTSTGDGAANAANCPGTGASCRLRDALAAAATGDTITFSNSAAGGAVNFFDGSQHAITLNTGELTIGKSLTVTGPGASVLTVDANQASRVFNIGGGVTASLSGLTLANGKVSGNPSQGGGILNDGTLTITDCTLSGNSSSNSHEDIKNFGGGILNNGALTITGSTLSGNSVTGAGDYSVSKGGGIYNNGGTLTITGSTLSGNSTNNGGNSGLQTISRGGGIYTTGGTVTITNSTLSGNFTNSLDGGSGGASQGGGIYCDGGTLSLNSSTLSGNTAVGGSDNLGGGIRNVGGTVNARNTIIARNTAVTNPDLSGTLTSQGHNLIGDTTGASITGDTTGNVLNTDPKLGPLASNGGPAQTVRPLPGSPAIDTGDDCVADAMHCSDPNIPQLTTDQRGFARKAGAHVDIGAVEVSYAISATAGTPQSANVGTAFATLLKATVTESGLPAPGVTVTFKAPSSGASGTFANGTTTTTANTDASGVATASAFTANGTPGSYNVTASAGGVTLSTSFSLTNTKLDQTINFGAIPDKTYGAADFDPGATASSGLPVVYTASGNCTILGGKVHINGAGSCTVTAKQGGDGSYNAAPDVPRSFNINKAATSTAVSSSPNPAGFGQSVTFTATVTSASATPSGTVTFKDGGTAIAGCENRPLSTGQAACTTGALAAGAHTITAEYSGDSNFLTSTGTLSGGQVVGSLFDFSRSLYIVAERGGQIVINVRRTGDTSQPVSVDYATDDGSVPSVFVPCAATTGAALDRCDYERALGTLHFAAGERELTFTVLVNDDSYVEGAETATLRLSNPTGGAALASVSTATLEITDDAVESAGNPLDDKEAFVAQHYRDFLNRAPDAPGLAFWTNQMTNCGSPNLEVCRVNVSAAFFLSIEFQQTGYLVERVNKTAYGDATGNSTLGGAHQLSVPFVRLNEFLRDTQQIGRDVIVGQGNWQQQLESNKQAFALEFVRRPEFVQHYPAQTGAAAFVNLLDQNAGGVLTTSEKSALVAELSPNPADAALRASVLNKVAENPLLAQRESNRAFVLMQYFGYLRRNPNDAPDADYTGYDFWLRKLEQFNGNFVQAEMVKAFLNSDEYRKRFAQ